MIFFDTETCGLHGPIVTIQYAIDDGPIEIHEVWNVPIQETLELIEMFCSHEGGVCGFNLAFDWFHICQLYTTLRLCKNRNEPPEIEEYALKEPEARLGPCCKPVTACDLMMVARKGPYQSTMDRNDIRIKRVPSQLAEPLAHELNKRIPLKDIYFARKADPKKRWSVVDIKDEEGRIVTEFKDLVLKFQPSSALKALAVDALGVDEGIKKFYNVEPKTKPKELGYAPFALAIGSPGHWRGSWPVVIPGHITHWSYNTLAREYAEDDVKYTRQLYEYFGRPEPGDVDSILTCLVGAVRWRGFKIDIEGIKTLRNKAVDLVRNCEVNVNSVDVCRRYLEEVMEDVEKAVIRVDGKITTKAVILEEIASWTRQDICDCQGMEESCEKCGGDGLLDTDEPHPAAQRARLILDVRHAKKEIELYDKLLRAGRLHASFKVIGTLSSRMAGADGLNPQGIKGTPAVRKNFPLADGDLILCGGDFESFEMSIMDTAYPDPKLHGELLSDKKIHALWGERYFFPHMTYDEIVASKESDDTWENKYLRSKQGVFAYCYFGEAFTFETRVGIPPNVAASAYEGIEKDYRDLSSKRKVVIDQFCSMKQPGGLGTKVEWADPAEYVESILGFKRYFSLENQIVKVLFELAEKPPKEWSDLNITVVRRDRAQTACGALRSALFAAAFAQQASNMRAAGNHKIQSTGGELCKILEADLWTLQPSGICAWRVQPMNIHDELMVAMLRKLTGQARQIVENFLKKYRKIIPLLDIDWRDNLENWAGKS